MQMKQSSLPLESSLAFCVARSASQCRAEEELPLISLEPGVRALAGPAVLLLALLLPKASAWFPSVPGSTFTTATVVGSPSGRCVAEVDAAPFPVLQAVPDCKIKIKLNPFNIAFLLHNCVKYLAVMSPYIVCSHHINDRKLLLL